MWQGFAAFEGESVVLNLSRMRKIRLVDVANNAITVEAGVPLAVVQAAAEEVDRLFPCPWRAKAPAK